MPGLVHFWHYLRLRWKWRQARRRGKTLRFGTGNAREFLRALNAAEVRYVVLRWFNDVALALQPTGKSPPTHDIDFLADADQIEKIIRTAATFPGALKCDIYTPTGRRGTAYKRMPYYPPVLAHELLLHRELWRSEFYVPAPEWHFKSLAFHLVYHKGARSGIPTGTSVPTDPAPARPYGELLEVLGKEVGIPLTRPYTLLALHEYLKQEEWAMPHDLMVRWPEQHPWMRWLADREEVRFEGFARALPDLFVFLLRADALEPEIQAAAVELLGSRFQILRSDALDPAAVRRVVRSVRGGNWMEHGKTVLVEPRVALVCHDPRPQLVPDNDPRRRKYPFVRNANAFFKNELRERLNQMFPDSPKRLAIHGSDNAAEAQHYLRAVYGAQHPDICRQLERALAPAAPV